MSTPRFCIALVLLGCQQSLSLCTAQTRPGESAGAPIFVDRAAEYGIGFVHFNGMSGEFYTSENVGGGGALFDYDNDGDLDIYLVQGNMHGPGKSLDEAIFPPRHSLPLSDRLYRNDLVVDGQGTVRPRFVDVTETIGLAALGYGMGVMAADYDNDGWVDLYVTNFGANQLLHNSGDGTFGDVTAEAGADDPRWSVPASFFDYDGDGWLDLFVGNYLDYSLGLHAPCPDATGAPGYCSPMSYGAQGDSLFRNRGDGTFENVTVGAGLETETGPALGSVTADFNGDGLTDLYVANDMMPNLLWINRGDGSFLNEALLAGCAVNWEGEEEASMGVDAADIDGDGDEDLIMGHLTNQTNTLYLNDGIGSFEDATIGSGLGYSSRSATTFGTAWLDFDNDGRLDLLTVNGSVSIISELLQTGDPYPLHQANQLYQQTPAGDFVQVSTLAGPVFELSEVSRGVAVGDIDNDGDPDVLVVNNAGPARLLINELGQQGNWAGWRLTDGEPSRDALGSRVEIVAGDGSRYWRRSRTDGSFASAHDPRVLLGLPAGVGIESSRIHWQGGGKVELRALPTRRFFVVHRRVRDPSLR